jgi:hypothetical protein
MTSLYSGDVLADCPQCRTVIEVQEGWVTPAHGECLGGDVPTNFEKLRHEAASRAFHKPHPRSLKGINDRLRAAAKDGGA